MPGLVGRLSLSTTLLVVPSPKVSVTWKVTISPILRLCASAPVGLSLVDSTALVASTGRVTTELCAVRVPASGPTEKSAPFETAAKCVTVAVLVIT